MTDPASTIGAPDLQVHGLTWERIQFTIHCLRADGANLEPAALGLRRDDTSRGEPAIMPATHVDQDDDQIRIRFNVMLGPDQMPLDPGRWRLVAGDTPVVVSAPGPDLVLAAGRFAIARGLFVASPLIDSSTGALCVDVSLIPRDQIPTDPTADAPPSRGRLATVQRRWVRQVRNRSFQVLYAIARSIAGRGGRRTVLFTSDSRAELGGNLKVVWDRMVERGLDREYRMTTLFKQSIADRRPFLDRLRLPWLLATADVILIDDYQPAIYRIDDPHVRIIQLWHASGAFKTVGYSRVGKPGGPSPYGRRHKNYAHAIVSSELDVPFYAEAFGIPESRVVPTGIPRMDRFFDPVARQAGRAAALELFPAARGRRTILFAPTFRGGTRTASYDMGRVDLAALHAVATEQDAFVIFKMHPFVREPLHIPVELSDRLVDATGSPIDVNDLLFVVDLLITDYSSIVFEYSTLGGPMLFYAYDLEEYIADRDFYIPFEEFVPGPIVRTFDELLLAIRSGGDQVDQRVERVAAFAQRHFAHLDGSSTDRVIDELVIGG